MHAVALPKRSTGGSLSPDALEHEIVRETPNRETVSPMVPLVGFLGLDGERKEAPRQSAARRLVQDLVVKQLVS